MKSFSFGQRGEGSVEDQKGGWGLEEQGESKSGEGKCKWEGEEDEGEGEGEGEDGWFQAPGSQDEEQGESSLHLND